jgi:hypothetical protein
VLSSCWAAHVVLSADTSTAQMTAVAQAMRRLQTCREGAGMVLNGAASAHKLAKKLTRPMADICESDEESHGSVKLSSVDRH